MWNSQITWFKTSFTAIGVLNILIFIYHRKIKIWIYIPMSIKYIIYILNGSFETMIQEHNRKTLIQISVLRLRGRISYSLNPRHHSVWNIFPVFLPIQPGYLPMFLMSLNDITAAFPFIQAMEVIFYYSLSSFSTFISASDLAQLWFLWECKVHSSPSFPFSLLYLYPH